MLPLSAPRACSRESRLPQFPSLYSLLPYAQFPASELAGGKAAASCRTPASLRLTAGPSFLRSGSHGKLFIAVGSKCCNRKSPRHKAGAVTTWPARAEAALECRPATEPMSFSAASKAPPFQIRGEKPGLGIQMVRGIAKIFRVRVQCLSPVSRAPCYGRHSVARVSPPASS